MGSEYPIIWSEEAIRNLESILEYLNSRWTPREVNNFKSLISKQIKLISLNPGLFPVSEFQPRLRKAVLSRQTTIFYEFKQEVVYLVYIFNTAQNPDKIK